jgi:hypothetical protein
MINCLLFLTEYFLGKDVICLKLEKFSKSRQFLSFSIASFGSYPRLRAKA